MFRPRVFVGSLAVIAAVFIATPSNAQDSRAYAAMSRQTFAAFECTTLAGEAGYPKEQERLFEFGYERGQEFLDALTEGLIERDHLESTAPTIMLLALQGPSVDFMLGRVFEWAQRLTLDELYEAPRVRDDDSVRRLEARNLFSRRNCDAIGR